MDTSKNISPDCIAKWQHLVDRESAFYSARMDLLGNCREHLVELVQNGLNNPAHRVTALGVVSLLTIKEKKELFNDLLSLASFGHGLTHKAQELILSLPRDWVLDNIEHAVEPFLQYNNYEEYQRFLELYSQLDNTIAINLANRAAKHPNEDIKEIGEHFLNLLR